jgi:hypothetical protein
VTSIVIALITLLASIISASLLLFGQFRSERRSERREAERAFGLYKEPLISAAYDLQSRIHHMLRGNFLDYIRDDKWGRRKVALDVTAFAFAQYFGWREILRREIPLLEHETAEIRKLLNKITGTFVSDKDGSSFLMWTAEQRAVGEAMIGRWRGSPACVGFGEFMSRRDVLGPWIAALTKDLDALAATGEGKSRLIEVQHLLVALIVALDPGGIRYDEDRLLPA